MELTSAQHGRTLQRPPFRSRNNRPLRALVSRHKLSFRDLVEMMAERDLSWRNDDHALNSTLCARIRETLEPLRSTSWTDLARRRDLYVQLKGRWTYLYRAVDKEEEPSTSCCAPSGTSPRPKPSSGLLSGVRADCRQNHARRLSGLTSRSKRGPGRTSEGINARSDRQHP